MTNIEENVHEFDIEVYGKGCIMWFLSQGENIEIISPVELREEVREKINKMIQIYNKGE